MADDDYDDDFEDYEADEFEDDAEYDAAPRPPANSAFRQTVTVGGVSQPAQVGGIGIQPASSRQMPPPSVAHPVAQPQTMPQMMGGLASRFSGAGDSGAAPPAYQAYSEEADAGFAPQERHFVVPASNEARQLKEQRRARAKALRGVLQLREVDITLFDASPLTPYELHTRHLSRHLHAKASYTGSDNLTVGLQTDEIEVTEHGAQWPEDQSAQTEHAASKSAQTESLLTANVGRLRRFLVSAGQVVETLCTENLMAARGASATGFNRSNSLPFSMRHTQLELPPALGARCPHDLAFDASGSSLVAAFGKPQGPLPHEADPSIQIRKRDAAALRRLATGGVLAQWRLYRPDAPWAVMRCVGVPSVCMLPEAKPHLVFAGTEEGSIQLWNLREPGSSHPSIDMEGGDRMALRAPTYSSDCLASGAHVSPITHIEPLPLSGEEGDLSIASLELDGTVLLWVVLESVELDAHDLGQAVGGKERLLRSGTLALTDDAPDVSGGGGGSRGGSVHGGSLGGISRRVVGGGGPGGAGAGLSVLPTRCVSMAFIPTDPSRLLLSTDLPELLHRSRYADQPLSPASFTAQGTQADSAGVCNVAFCPSSPSHFVAGRSDGSLSLYHVDDPVPLLTWAGFGASAILQVVWSTSRPAVVWALDDDDTLHAIDITDESAKPFLSSRAHSGGDGGGTAPEATSNGGGGAKGEARPLRTRMAIDRQAGQVDGAAAAGQRLVAVTCRDGGGLPRGIEVHVLADNCAVAVADEAAKLAHFLSRL